MGHPPSPSPRSGGSSGLPRVLPLGESSTGWCYRCTQHGVDIVSGPAVLQRKGVGIVPKRRGGITVAEPLLGPEQLAPTNQKRGDGVAQVVEADPGQVRLGTQLGEPVAHATGRKAPLVVDIRREDPFAERGTLAPPTPGPLTGPPELDGGPAEGEPSGPTCSPETPRSIVSTLPSRSLNLKATALLR